MLDGRSIPYGEAIDCVNELRSEFGTHLHAADAGWDFPASYGEVIALVQAQAFIAVHRDPKKPPVDLPTPWPGAEPRFSPEEVEAAEKELRRRSAISD